MDACAAWSRTMTADASPLTPFADPSVAHVFAAVPARAQRKLLALRQLILETAARTPGVGAIEEALKWGEPAYLTLETGAGSTIRLGWRSSDPARIALLFHCQTNLVERFRERFSERLRFEGNRAVVLDVASALPRAALAACIEAALTYHLAAKRVAKTRARRKSHDGGAKRGARRLLPSKR